MTSVAFFSNYLHEIKQYEAMAALPQCTVKFPHNKIRTLLDTGAFSNFIDQTLVRKLIFQTQILNLTVVARGAWSDDLFVKEYCKIEFCIQNKKCEVVVPVIPKELSCNMVLWIPFVNKYRYFMEDIYNLIIKSLDQPIKNVSWGNVKKSTNKEGHEIFLCWISLTQNSVTNGPAFSEEDFAGTVVGKLLHHSVTVHAIRQEIHNIVPGSSPVFKRPYRMLES